MVSATPLLSTLTFTGATVSTSLVPADVLFIIFMILGASLLRCVPMGTMKNRILHIFFLRSILKICRGIIRANAIEMTELEICRTRANECLCNKLVDQAGSNETISRETNAEMTFFGWEPFQDLPAHPAAMSGHPHKTANTTLVRHFVKIFIPTDRKPVFHSVHTSERKPVPTHG